MRHIRRSTPLKSRLPALAVITGLWLTGAACAEPGDAARAIAEADVNRWNQAIATRDIDKLAALFTPDAMLIQPNGQAVKSDQAIRTFWKSLLESLHGKSGFRLVKARRDSDDTVVTRVELTASKNLEQQAEAIRYHYQGLVNHVLKQQADGSWRVQVQRWNDGTRLTQEQDEPAR